MGWYDIIDDIAQRQFAKTALGDNQLNGVTVGIVAKKYSKEMPGRVCVQIPVRDKEANVLQWARIAAPSAGKKWGTFFLPEIGDQVLLAFEEGNIDKPYIIGCIQGDSGSFLSKMADEDNQYKCITTKSGNRILFEDNKEGEGDKDKITIETAKSVCQILMDNEKQALTLTDKQKKNFEVGDIKISLNGDSGKISIDCNKLTLSASEGIKMEADNMVSLKGGNTVVAGSSSLKMTSGSAAVLEGSLIKIG